jgi:hypothetical protein
MRRAPSNRSPRTSSRRPGNVSLQALTRLAAARRDTGRPSPADPGSTCGAGAGGLPDPGPAARRSFGADRLLRRTPAHAGASAARGAPRLLSERSLRRGTPFLALERVPHREVFACPTAACRRVRRLAARSPWCSRRRASGRRASRPPDAPHSSGSRSPASSSVPRACPPGRSGSHECRAWVLEDFPLHLGRRARVRVSLFGSAESSFFWGRAHSGPVAPTRARR